MINAGVVYRVYWYMIMFRIVTEEGGGKILGKLVGSNRGVVVGVFWGNMI